MEADWEVEIGPGSPMIEAHWPGFADLRRSPASAANLPEASLLDGLAGALVRLNGAGSPVWTSKCDVWPVLDSSEYDAGEMDAPPESAIHAWACYIDLLPGAAQLPAQLPAQLTTQAWADAATAVHWCKGVCQRLHSVPLRSSRVDLIVRSAVISPDSLEATDIGITAYLTACGATPEVANGLLANALARFADAICSHSTVE